MTPDGNNMQVLLNANDITDTITVTDEMNIDSMEPVSFERVSENSVRTTFTEGASVTVSLSFGILSFSTFFSDNFQLSSALGLMGNSDGDASNDLKYPNGTILDSNSTDSLIHEYGQSCKYILLWHLNTHNSTIVTYSATPLIQTPELWAPPSTGQLSQLSCLFN